MDKNDLNNRFTNHVVLEDDAVHMSEIRSACAAAAEVIDTLAPDGREKSLAVTHLEEAAFWANAAIARAGEAL